MLHLHVQLSPNNYSFPAPSKFNFVYVDEVCNFPLQAQRARDVGMEYALARAKPMSLFCTLHTTHNNFLFFVLYTQNTTFCTQVQDLSVAQLLLLQHLHVDPSSGSGYVFAGKIASCENALFF